MLQEAGLHESLLSGNPLEGKPYLPWGIFLEWVFHPCILREDAAGPGVRSRMSPFPDWRTGGFSYRGGPVWISQGFYRVRKNLCLWMCKQHLDNLLAGYFLPSAFVCPCSGQWGDVMETWRCCAWGSGVTWTGHKGAQDGEVTWGGHEGAWDKVALCFPHLHSCQEHNFPCEGQMWRSSLAVHPLAFGVDLCSCTETINPLR